MEEMNDITLSTTNMFILSQGEWEEFKRLGDKELYKLYNGYADYEEIRICVEDGCVGFEAHCIKEEKDKDE